MSNGSANCLLQVCCDPPAALSKMAQTLENDLGMPPEYASKCAAWIYEHFDLAERGTLKPFKDSIARLARENP